MIISNGRDPDPAVPGSAYARHIGDVQLDAVLKADGVFVNNAFYGACSRTSWHVHEVGQLIFVTSGRGVVVTRNGHRDEVRAGDVTYTPAGEEHWHGAAPDTFFTYASVSLGSVDTHEEVGDDVYASAWADR